MQGCAAARKHATKGGSESCSPPFYRGSVSEAGSCFRLTDFVYHSTLDLRVIKKKKKKTRGPP